MCIYDIFFIGDIYSNNGPGIANRAKVNGLKNINKKICVSSEHTILKILEIPFKIFLSKRIVLCTFSYKNMIIIHLAKIFNKQCIYIFHGYPSLEYKINTIEYDSTIYNELRLYESKIIKSCDKIIFVSKVFKEYMTNDYPQYQDKYKVNNNIILFNKKKNSSKERDKKYILSIGGGQKIKNCIKICQAIDILNKTHNKNLEFICIGKAYTDKDLICKFPFVKYYDQLPYDEVLSIMEKSYLYVQNSYFDSFCMSIIEALYQGCNILISSNVGAIDLFQNIQEQDLINNIDDEYEIANKIYNIMINENNNRLLSSLKTKEIESNHLANELFREIMYE